MKNIGRNSYGEVAVKLYQASKDDAAFLRDMLYHAIFVPPGSPHPPHTIIDAPELMAYVRGFGTQIGDIGVIAEVENKQVGAAWVRLMRGYGYVDSQTPELTIAVLPTHRGHGIGSRLLRELFLMVDKSYSQISLSVQSANPAHRLYRRFGFVVVDEQDGTYTMVRTMETQSATNTDFRLD